jgi:hypothetical protein
LVHGMHAACFHIFVHHCAPVMFGPSRLLGSFKFSLRASLDGSFPFFPFWLKVDTLSSAGSLVHDNVPAFRSPPATQRNATSPGGFQCPDSYRFVVLDEREPPRPLPPCQKHKVLSVRTSDQPYSNYPSDATTDTGFSNPF